MIFNMKDLIQNFIPSKSFIGECLTVDLSSFAFFFPELSWDKTTDYRVNWKKKYSSKEYTYEFWAILAVMKLPPIWLAGLITSLVLWKRQITIREISRKTCKFTHRGHIHVHEICRKELIGVNLICTMQVLTYINGISSIKHAHVRRIKGWQCT